MDRAAKRRRLVAGPVGEYALLLRNHNSNLWAFKFAPNKLPHSLRKLPLALKQHKLCVITGAIGSGKTYFVSLALRDEASVYACSAVDLDVGSLRKALLRCSVVWIDDVDCAPSHLVKSLPKMLRQALAKVIVTCVVKPQWVRQAHVICISPMRTETVQSLVKRCTGVDVQHVGHDIRAAFNAAQLCGDKIDVALQGFDAYKRALKLTCAERCVESGYLYHHHKQVYKSLTDVNRAARIADALSLYDVHPCHMLVEATLAA